MNPKSLKRFSVLLILLGMLAAAVCATSSDDNIFIAERTVTCRLNARDGRVSGAKVSQDYTMTARRVHDMGLLVTFYDRNSTVDNASATGGKPRYRAWEDGDIFYSGTRACLLPVEVKPGKKSQARFQVSYASPEFIDDIMLTSSLYDIAREQVSVHIPAEVAEMVTVDILNATGREKTTREVDPKGNVTVIVTVDSVEALSREPLMPEAAVCIPMVRVNAAFADLSELYAYLRVKLEPLDTPDAEIAGLAARLAAEAGPDTLARIDAVARWVRENIRYVAIEYGELAHKPSPASEVLAKRYGDCKGSANLICALLRAVGIDGRRVWVGTKGAVPAPFSARPSLGSANHMIAAAVVSDSIVYIDGTTSFAPRGFVPPSIAGQECMIENGDTFILANVCAPCPSQSVLRQTGSMEIDGTALRGPMRYDMSGVWRCMIESIMSGINATRRSQVLAAFLAMGRKSITIDNAELLPSPVYDADTSSIAASICDNEAVRAVSARSRLYVMPRPLRMAQIATVDARKRRLPVDCSDFLPVESDILIEIPQGYVADGLPRTVTVDNPWFEGHVTYSAGHGSTVRCTAALHQRRENAAPDEASAWNEAVKDVEKASNTALVLLRKPSE